MALLAIMAGLPGAALIVATATMLLALPFGVDPVWRVEPLSLPEAAALRDAGEVLRLINGGGDPDVPGTVRGYFLRNDAVVVTPLEAAVAADRTDVLEVLLDNGASLDAPTMTRLICFARAIEADGAGAFLQEQRPADVPASCEHVQTPW